MSKYELLQTDTKIWMGRTLFRVRALKDFGAVKKGELGGYIEKEKNLSQEGNAWVGDDAWVVGNAQVRGNALVVGNAWVEGNAQVRGNARVEGNARVGGNAWVEGNARVVGDAQVRGNARVGGNAWVEGNARVVGDAQVRGDADYLCIKGIGSEYRHTTVYRGRKGIEVTCGCFQGTLQKFEAKVKETHGDSKYAKEYQLFIEIVKLHFMEEETIA